MTINTYIPDFFKSSLDRFQALEDIQSSMFGQLITSVGPGETYISYTPIQIYDNSFIFHLAAGNPHCEFIAGHNISFVAMGTHGYISPSWYINNSVPTWDYTLCILNGVATEIHSTEKAIKSLVDITEFFERQHNASWKIDSLGEERVNNVLSRLRFFEVSIDSAEYKSKMSQNKSQEDIRSVIKNLEDIGRFSLAKCIKDENNE